MSSRAVITWAVVAISVSPALADDSDLPTTHDAWLDAALTPHRENPAPQAFVEGDSLTIHVDPTRLFADPSTPVGQLGFAAEGAPPEVGGFYVVGTGGGVKTPLSFQHGLCGVAAAEATARARREELGTQKTARAELAASGTATPEATAKAEQDVKAAEDAVKVASDALEAARTASAANNYPEVAPTKGSGLCEAAADWQLNDKAATAYVCHREQPLGKLLDESADWSFVQRVPSRDAAHPSKLLCIGSWHFEKAPAVTGVMAEVVNGASAPELVALTKVKDAWSGTFPIKRNTREVRLITSYEGTPPTRRILAVQPAARDTHSPVRIQAEILGTNRLRSVSFAVAISPVRRKFFTDGPSMDCKLLCALTPTALIRLSGDDKTVVQLGGGLALNFARPFQINAGLLFGTGDTGTAWRVERNWYVGIAIDPVLLSEAISTSGAFKKE